MILATHAFSFLLTLPLIVQSVAIPVRNHQSIAVNNGDPPIQVDQAAVAQPAVQSDRGETVAAMELPVLSGNATEEKSRVSDMQPVVQPVVQQVIQSHNTPFGKHSHEEADNQKLKETEDDPQTAHVESTNPEPATSPPASLEKKQSKEPAAIDDATTKPDSLLLSTDTSKAPHPISERQNEAIIVSHNIATPPSPYTPGWCGLHVRQTYFPTCLHFAHTNCTRINSTITLYDASQRLLASANTTLTYDGTSTFSLFSALPFPLVFRQLGIVDGVNQALGSWNARNYWPMWMAYGADKDGEGWRNDEVPRCKFGEWEGFLRNRDFDCGFACP